MMMSCSPSSDVQIFSCRLERSSAPASWEGEVPAEPRIVAGFMERRQPRPPALSADTQSPSRCNAFTLLEMLIAVGLTTLLLAAIYTSMSVYWETAAESYDEIERGQIARALLREIARDIQSCTFVTQDLSDSDDTDADDTEEDSGAVVDPDSVIADYTSGLVGTDRDLTLYISRPDPEQNYFSAAELMSAEDRSSDAMIVRYLLIEDGGSGLAGLFATENDKLIDAPVKGLARMQGDLAGLSNAVRLGDLEMQVAATDMLAAEVALVRFRYYDGVDELEEWDSTVQNAMPLAVIVELVLRTLPTSNVDRASEDVAGFLKETVHRLVIPLPVAEPFVEATI